MTWWEIGTAHLLPKEIPIKGVNFGGVTDKIVAEQPVDPSKCYYCQHGIAEGEPAKLVQFYRTKQWCHQGGGKQCADLLEKEWRDATIVPTEGKPEKVIDEADVPAFSTGGVPTTIVGHNQAPQQLDEDIVCQGAGIMPAMDGEVQPWIPDTEELASMKANLASAVAQDFPVTSSPDAIILGYILGGHGFQASPQLIEQLLEWKRR